MVCLILGDVDIDVWKLMCFVFWLCDLIRWCVIYGNDIWLFCVVSKGGCVICGDY